MQCFLSALRQPRAEGAGNAPGASTVQWLAIAPQMKSCHLNGLRREEGLQCRRMENDVSMFRLISYASMLVCYFLPTASVLAQPAAIERGALASMPVKEVTVFKDGHALVVHEGRMPTDGDGNVQMDYLPIPVLGTFWPYAQSNGPKLTSVVASPRLVRVRRTALTIKEMLESNVGGDALITEVGGKKYTAKIIGIPQRTSQEIERTNAPGEGERLPVTAEVILLKTAAGTQVLPLGRIQDVTFAGKYNPVVSHDEFRNLLTLKLDWTGRTRSNTADVGMMYLQKGLRWIPSYKVSMDGHGGAVIALQATLINDMTDLKDVTANLVIGVPTFFYQDMIDPIALQQTMSQLSNYFSPNSPTGYAMSNSLMGQAGGFGGGGSFGDRGAGGPSGAAGGEQGPEVIASGKNEDLFVFNVRHVTLKKGQRMTLPVIETTMKYHDIYTVDLSFTPPHELRSNGSITEQQQELLRAMNRPKAEHKIRLTNETKYPLTTAPALILSGGKLVAQAMMTYTAAGGETDLRLTTAVNIKIKKTDKEVARTPNAETYQNGVFGRVDLSGTITITNYDSSPADLEVTRNVLGNVAKADHDGVPEMVNVFEDDSFAPRDYQSPFWWGWYSWPYWWNHFNGVGRVSWKVTLNPAQTIDLGYTWNYIWQ